MKINTISINTIRIHRKYKHSKDNSSKFFYITSYNKKKMLEKHICY